MQLFITSEIPGTRPLIVKYKIGSTLQKARETWCQLQGFSAEMTRDVIFAWKNKKVHDSTKVKRLGIKVDQSGCITVEGTAELYDDEENLPKIHVEAFTEDSFQERERQLEEEAVARKRAARTSPPAEEVIEVEEPPPEKATIKLILKAKSKDDFKLTVHPVGLSSHCSRQGHHILDAH